jgi:hypothetical protein
MQAICPPLLATTYTQKQEFAPRPGLNRPRSGEALAVVDAVATPAIISRQYASTCPIGSRAAFCCGDCFPIRL